MLNLILGPAYSGKSEYLVNLLGELAAQDHDKLILIVPDQSSFSTERMVLSRLGAKKAAKIKIMRFNRLAEEIFNRYGGEKGVHIGDSGKLMLMSSALHSVKSELSAFSNQVSKPEFAKEMVRLYDNLKYDAVDCEMLEGSVEKLSGDLLKNKVRDISLVCRAYEKELGEEFANAPDSLWRALEILSDKNFFEGYTVCFDSFSHFDNLKLKVITKAMEQSENVYITLPTDSLNISKNEIGRFLNVKKTGLRLKKCAEDCGCEVANDIVLRSDIQREDLSALEKNIYSDKIEAFSGETENITVFEACTIIDECEIVARTIRKLIRENSYRLRDIAVIMRDDKYLEPVRRSLAKHSLPVFSDARKTVYCEPLVLFAGYVFSIVNKGFKTDDVLGMLKTGVLNIDTMLVGELEKYVYVWQINGVKKWCEDFTLNPSGFKKEFSEKDKQLLEKLNAFKSSFINPLLKFKKRVKNANAKQYCTAFFSLMEDFEADKGIKKLALEFEKRGETDSAARQHGVYTLLIDTMDQAVLTLGEREISFKEFSELFLPALESSTVGEIPNQLDEITLGNASRMRTVSPKVAFVLGANEGEFPTTSVSSGILNEGEKMKLRKAGVDFGESSEKLFIEEKFFAYCALTAPSEKLYVSYRTNELTGETKGPSDIVLYLCSIFPSLAVKKAESLSAEDIESEEQAFEYLAANWSKRTELVATLKEYFSSSEKYSGKYAALKRSTDFTPEQIEDKELCKDLFGSTVNLSATKFETYNKCPFSYFCRYGMGIVPMRTAQIDYRISGSLVHYVMEKFLYAHKDDDFENITKETVHNETVALVFEYMKNEMGVNYGDLPYRAYIYFAKGTDIIEQTLVAICDDFAKSEFKPKEFEYKIGKGNLLYELNCDEGKISVEGSVDRIDVMNCESGEYLRVIDYKTGNKEFNLSEVLHGINAQMLIYLMALVSQGSEYYGANPAGVLYMHAATLGSSKVDRGSDPNEVNLQNKLKYRMKGMVLDDKTVIQGMEPIVAGECMHIPVKREVKNGKDRYLGNVISQKDLELVFEKTENMLVGMGNSLHNGQIGAQPAVFPDSSPCDYCDYKGICRHFESIGERRYDKTSNFSSALNQLRNESIKEDGHEC